MRPLWTALILAAAVSGAQAQPAQKQVDGWFADLAKAESAEDAQPIEEKIEAAFRQSGSPSVDLLMSRAKESVSGGDSKTASTIVTAVNKLAPAYAEGWRLRAMLDAASGEDSAAMLALQKVITLNPRHFGAMTELAGMLEDYGDKAGALKLYRQVQSLSPRNEAATNRIRALSREVEGQGI